MRIKDYFTLCALLLISVAGEIYALENFQGKLHLNLQQQSVKIRPLKRRVTAWSKICSSHKICKYFTFIFIKNYKTEKRFKATKSQLNRDSHQEQELGKKKTLQVHPVQTSVHSAVTSQSFLQWETDHQESGCLTDHHIIEKLGRTRGELVPDLLLPY